jgi:hypothetical protein
VLGAHSPTPLATRRHALRLGDVVRVLPIEVARRLAISAQLLDAPRRAATRDGILDVVRQLTRLQVDPTAAVERSHLLVLWSRVGPFDREILRRLLEEERALFEHRAFIVPTEDYELYAAVMRAGRSAIPPAPSRSVPG